jgi:RecA/RadA recombinase
MAKAAKEKEVVRPAGPPRTWSADERARYFIESHKKDKPDFQVLTSDYEEELIPYGFLTFDYILGLKGMARHGRVTQIHGNEGVGKSTLTYELAKNYQRFTGEPLAVFDFEGTGTPAYLKKIGVNMSMVYFIQPSSIEDAIIETIKLLQGGTRFFVYDSIPHMESMVDVKEILNRKAFKGNYGNHAKGMARFYRLLHPHVIQNDGHMLMINQTRDRIEDTREAQNAQKYPTFTNLPYSLPGGRMCRFKPSVMVEMKMVKEVKALKAGKDSKFDPFVIEPETPQNENRPIVNRVRCRTLKNKVTGTGYREGYIWVRPGVGVDEGMSVLEYAREYGLINNKGSKWYVGHSFDQAVVGYPDKESAIDDLTVKRNPEVLEKLRNMVIEAIEADTSGRHAGAGLTPEEEAFIDGEEVATVSKAFDIDDEE